MFCSGPWDLEAIQSKNPDLNLNMMPFYGTKASAGWLIGGPGCGFAVNENSANKEAALKVLAAIATEEGQKAPWENNQGGSSYMSGVSSTCLRSTPAFPLPSTPAMSTALGTSGALLLVPTRITAPRCRSTCWASEDLSAALSNVDAAVAELLSK
ncbi:MAG: hypothetical protein ACLVJ6_08470 [Merdibacter sp.]